MIFWVLLGLAVIATIIITVGAVYDDGPIRLFLGLVVGGLISVGVGGLLFAICVAFFWNGLTPVKTGATERDLVALQTSSTVEGRSYFLGSGYVDGKRVLNYITVDDGAYRVESSDAVNSWIYESDEDPIVRVEHYDFVNPWLAPFALGGADAYSFYIPEGSVLSDYTIDNG